MLRGRGSAVLVTGEPGIGKTRFCGEAADRAGAAGLVVAGARCWPEGGSPAMWPWPPLLDVLCGSDTSHRLLPGTATGPDRFGVFVGVADRLAEVCTRKPACIVIDDVDAAGRGALLLLRFVARALDRLPLLLILARGDPSPGSGDPERATLLEAIGREADPFPLQPFDGHEATSFLAGRGLTDLDPDLVSTLLRITGGNPLHLGRIAPPAGEPAGGAGTDPGRRPDPEAGRRPGAGPRLAVEAAFDRLEPGTRHLLSCAALLGLTPSIAEAAHVTGIRTGRVIESVVEASRVGLVGSIGPGRFSFGHELVREVAESALAVIERLDTHARAAQIVGGPVPFGGDGAATRRARHAVLAAARSRADAARGVAACREAAREQALGLGYESAASLLEQAVTLHTTADLGPPPAALLHEWARVVLDSGRLAEARPLFERVAEAARREDDPILAAEAALGLGGVWVNETRAPVDRARVSSLQRTALAGLPAGESALRSRLRSRLAAEATYDGGPIDAVRDALEDARRTGDPQARAEALSLAHHAMLAPEHAAERLAMADELVAVASGARLPVLSLMGLCWRAVDLFHLGDQRARRALEDLRDHADAVGCRSILYIVEVLDVMLLIRAGRLEEATRRSAAAYETGAAVGDIDAFAYFGAQTVMVHWLQGREAEVLDGVEEAAASTTLDRGEFAFRATAANLAARCGRTDRARAGLAALAEGGLGSLPRSSTWLTGMSTIAETAYLLRDAERAGAAGALLRPFAALPVMPSLGVVCLGSTERPLGLAALATGDHDAAVGHLEAAVAADIRLGNRPLTAMSRADLAEALRRRGRPGDDTRARTELEAAAAGADAAEMPARAAAWRDAARERRVASVGAGIGDADEDRDGDRRGPASLRRRPRGWLVCAADRRVAVGDRVGFGYLAQLVAHPDEEIGALALASGGQVVDASPRQEMLDDTARREYAAQARRLTSDLEEAEGRDDRAAAERLRDELDALVDEVERATARGGRARGFAGPAERARTSVRKAIVRALDEIADADPELGAWFRPRVVTGSRCSFRPDPRSPTPARRIHP